ncbi:MAG: glycosyltransferase [Bacteroidales bacterium]|jgi:glycosyltransferase involved in cell wall biosynthesis|nr:glycosyltransferase [Bacteroidales bacterium]
MKPNNELLQRIARYLMLHGSFIDNTGLLSGKTGIAIFFYHYSRYTGEKIYDDFAGELIDEIYSEIHVNTPCDFKDGLCGIGWGMEYLIRNNFVIADSDEAPEDLDKRIMERDVRRITDYSLETGLKGIACYVIGRRKNRDNENPYIGQGYIQDLIEENAKVIVFAGRLDEVKGLGGLINAFKRILATHADARLFILGDGDFNVRLKEASGIWAKITFTGRVDKKTLYEFYGLADMGVVCSLHEEFGFVAIEMMMHELPLIVTETGGLDEIAEDGISGLKVPILTVNDKRQVDVKCLTEKMAFLLDNPVYAKELGENGRKRFLGKYDLPLFKEKMMNLYNSV